MMGMRVIGDDGYFQIDGEYRNLKLKKQVTLVMNQPNCFYHHDSGSYSNEVLVAIRVTVPSRKFRTIWTLWPSPRQTPTFFWMPVPYAPVGTTLSIAVDTGRYNSGDGGLPAFSGEVIAYIYDVPNDPPANDWGLRVNNGQGLPVFTSDGKHLRVERYISGSQPGFNGFPSIKNGPRISHPVPAGGVYAVCALQNASQYEGSTVNEGSEGVSWYDISPGSIGSTMVIYDNITSGTNTWWHDPYYSALILDVRDTLY